MARFTRSDPELQWGHSSGEDAQSQLGDALLQTLLPTVRYLRVSVNKGGRRLCRRPPVGALLSTALAGATAFALWRGLVSVTVSGSSMEPTFLDGDRLMACRTPCWVVRRGRVVVAEAPPWAVPNSVRSRSGESEVSSPWIVKRVVAKLPASSAPLEGYPRPLNLRALPARHYLYLIGDGRASIDSRAWGPFPCYSVRGVVLFRYPSSTTPASKADACSP